MDGLLATIGAMKGERQWFKDKNTGPHAAVEAILGQWAAMVESGSKSFVLPPEIEWINNRQFQLVEVEDLTLGEARQKALAEARELRRSGNVPWK